MLTLRCPACRGEVGVHPSDLGHAVSCPICHQIFAAREELSEPRAEPDTASGPVATEDERPVTLLRSEDDDLDRPSLRRSRRRSHGRVDLDHAAELVSGPATGLQVTAGMGLALALVNFVLAITTQVAGNAFQPPGAPPRPPGQKLVDTAQSLAGGLIGLATSGVILVGAARMKRLESYTFAMVASIVAVVPCISPCCLVGLPFGIWAINTLNRSDVKEAFRAVADRE